MNAYDRKRDETGVGRVTILRHDEKTALRRVLDLSRLIGARLEGEIACHGSGVGGAPTLDDPENWQPRIAQGIDTLYLRAIEGYTGSAGYMPPKGARLDLSDGEVNDAVDYMVEQVSQ